MRESKLLAVALALVTAAFLLSAAIAAPILIRPFYYVQIGALRVAENTGLTPAQIREAYDETLDYCVGRSDTFSTGVLHWSPDGKAHFDDVRGLFLLDLRILAFSVVVLVLLSAASRVFRLRSARLAGRGCLFWAGAGLGALGILTGGLAALDFDRAFTVFHTLFFPGKSNWLFDPDLDQVIAILPEVYFRNCALLILAILVTGCALLILTDFRRRES